MDRLEATDARPNVLFVICDQLRADHLGYAGNPMVRTPAIDALAAEGTVFERAYVANPICMPSRSSIMTGRMPSAHGVIANDRSLAPTANTFVRSLRAAGWRTALVGKSHLQHGMTRSAVPPTTLEPATWDPFPAGWDSIEDPSRYDTGEVPDTDDFYGFERVELCLAHGAQILGHHLLWARQRDPRISDVLPPPDEMAERGRSTSAWWQAYPAPYPAELHSTSFVTERSIDFIGTAARADEPWMLWCSFPDPHLPVCPPEPWFSAHSPTEIDLPRTFADPGEDWPEHLRRKRATPVSANEQFWFLPFGPTEDVVRTAIAATYGMIEAIDDGIGRILRTVAELPGDRETIVVFTSDHGDMMGDHGLMLKGGMHYDGCIRTPLVIAGRGAPGATDRSLVSNIDLAPTILDLCGLPPHEAMQGRSLAGPLGSGGAAGPDAVLVENDSPLAGLFGLPGQIRTVVTDRYRYTRDSNGDEQLFDLVDDPEELVDLAVAGRAPSVRHEMVEALTDQLLHHADTAYPRPAGSPVPA